MTETEQLVRDISKGLIAWYQFHIQDSVLYIGNEDDALAELLYKMQEEGKIATVCLLSCNDFIENITWDTNENLFDVVISIEDIEKVADTARFLESVKKHLLPDGRLILGANNRLGIRYFCGDRDPYTGRNFDGIENYRRYAVKKEDVLPGRMYDKYTLDKMLKNAGFEYRFFYSVFSDLKNPALIYAEDFIPNEELSVRSFPMYNNPDTVFLEEEYLYTDLIRNGMFHVMANAFLIECAFQKPVRNDPRVEHITTSVDRGKENALFTIIYNNGIVEKRAVYKEGRKRLENLYIHGEELKNRGLSMVDAKIDNHAYVMPYINAETALSYLRRIAKADKIQFIHAMDKFYNTIKQSSDLYEKEDIKGKNNYLKKGYLDMVPLNCFIVDAEYVFYDQEFVLEDCPLGAVALRLVDQVYRGNFELEAIVPKNFFYKRYNLNDRVDEYRRIVSKFLDDLRNIQKLKVYYDKYSRDLEVVNSNRQRMNYSEGEYNRIFVDSLKDLGDRKLILFGSGAFAKQFISMYGKTYPIFAVIDNNSNRQGQSINGLEISSPEILRTMDKDACKVMICIKSYLSVVKQLEDMGIKNYGVFDPSCSYARTIKNENQSNIKPYGEECKVSNEPTKKKYRVGYVAGVFDLFHIGHVRLLQKAKEQCEYLIVGVVSDEDCYKQKDKYPIIPCEERVEVLKVCKYVDQVEPLPSGFGGIRDAYKMFQFDVQFSGDDHGEEGNWLANKEYLKKHGADLVFFNYTKGTSSTEIRKKM